ncbi:MAG: membrane dipeptidase, partial [Actinomycetota bacterium]
MATPIEDPEQDRRAARLHGESLVVDTLGPDGPAIYPPDLLARVNGMVAAGDGPSVIVRAIQTYTQRSLWDDGLPGFWDGWAESGVDVSSVTMGGFGENPFTFENAIHDLARWSHTFDVVPRFAKVVTADDARDAKADGRRGVILNFQNTTHFGDDLDKIELFYDFGIRIIQLTYNQRNLVGDGCTERNPAGLS